MFEDRYTIGARVAAPFDQAREAVVDALKAEGFGVIMTIDMAATLKAKIGAEIPHYEILGACNPPFALRSVTTDPSIGALLPCNVIVRADGAATVVEVMDPRAVLALVQMPGIAELGEEVRARLVRVIEAVAAQLPPAE